MLRPTAVRRTLGVVAAVAASAGAFTVGVLAGSDGPAVTSSAPSSAPRASVLDEAADQIAGEGVSSVDRQALDAAAIQGMLAAAGDQWGSWSTPATTAPTTASGYTGVGLWLRPGPDGTVVVAQVSPGSPSARADVAAGDEVRAVDVRSTRGRTAVAVAAALRGRPGTSVALLLRRGSALRTVRLVRADVPPPAVTVVRERSASGAAVARVVVPAFIAGTGRQVREAVQAAAADQVAGVVLDLRGDGGGLLDEAVETAGAFLDGGPVVGYARRDAPTERLDAVGTGNTTLPLVVLVDGGTASAAEVVAGALQDRGRAVLVGARTFGKGTVQEPMRLSDGSTLEVTVARYTTPSGRSLEGVGLEPDIEVAAGAGERVAVRRSVEVLTGLLADGSGTRG
jgi:carboxyl-terminal processing protease